jgi:hypothetical protein
MKRINSRQDDRLTEGREISLYCVKRGRSEWWLNYSAADEASAATPPAPVQLACLH